MNRIHNFSAGPCTLPLEVLEDVQNSFVDFNEQGMSLVEMSHRSKTVVEIHDEALALFREILAVPDTHEILFLGGGATLQFSMIPFNLLQNKKSADYTNSGAWAKKAISDGEKFGTINTVFDDSDNNYSRLPDPNNITFNPDSAYYHLTSNETIGGIQWGKFPDIDIPLVADMSSDILSKDISFDKFGIIYAGAQKNIAPAGLSVVIIRKDILESCPDDAPIYLNYKKHSKAESMLNTPPVFQIWMVNRVLQWLKEKGGISWANEMAEKRSSLLYSAVEEMSDFYSSPIDPAYQSQMNVVWRLPSEELEVQFVKEAEENGLSGLKGHRSVGGCRASIYNAMPIEGVQDLVSFMKEFSQKSG